MRTQLLAIVAVALALLTQSAAAQDNEPVEQVTVTAPQLRDAIRGFVRSVSATSQGQNQLARWDRRVCPMVAGLHRAEAQFVADRISQRAASVALSPGAPGCEVNMLIFFTPDSNRLAQQFSTQFQDVLALGHGSNTATPARAGLDAFVHSDRPVRWWHVARTVSADGKVVHDSDPRRNPRDVLEGLAIVRSSGIGVGRLSAVTRQEFGRVIIIVDVRRAQGQQFDALADYIAMVALAQIDPGAEIAGNDTILNLFSGSTPAPRAMTAWDVAYLSGLYGASRNAVNAHLQEGDINRGMARDLATQPPAAATPPN